MAATPALTPRTVESLRIEDAVRALHPDVRRGVIRAGETYMGVQALVGDEDFTKATLDVLADRMLLELAIEPPEHFTRDALVSKATRFARRLRVRTP